MNISKLIGWIALVLVLQAGQQRAAWSADNPSGGMVPSSADGDPFKLMDLPAQPAGDAGTKLGASVVPLPATTRSPFYANAQPTGNVVSAGYVAPTGGYPVPGGNYSVPAGYGPATNYAPVNAATTPEAIPPGATYGAPSGPYIDPNWQKYATPTVIREEVPMPAVNERPIESTWYTKIEYFHWNEEVGGTDLVNETGPLFTLGYQRLVGCERFRGELFGSQVDYSGEAFDNNNNVEPLSSVTNYLGVRAEYDYLFEPDTLPNVSFFAGIGTRIWNRDLPETTTASGSLVSATQEDWWTIYPYLGIERRRHPHGGVEVYWMARLGCTAITLEHNTDNTAALYPKPGLTAQLESGVRGSHLFLSAFSEVMYWNQSAVSAGWIQPTSTMVTVGLRTGTSF